MTVEWRGQPVWVIRRTPEMIEHIKQMDSKVLDPQSEEPQQPEYAQNQLRSLRPEFLVVVGICTHLGCSPQYRPEVGPADLGSDWLGGFFCPCHGSKFDLAGRVFKSVPAPLNLLVPPYSYIDDNTIMVGVDEETA